MSGGRQEALETLTISMTSLLTAASEIFFGADGLRMLRVIALVGLSAVAVFALSYHAKVTVNEDEQVEEYVENHTDLQHRSAFAAHTLPRSTQVNASIGSCGPPILVVPYLGHASPNLCAVSSLIRREGSYR